MKRGFDRIMTGVFDGTKRFYKGKYMMNMSFDHYFWLDPDYIPQVEANISPTFYIRCFHTHLE